MAVFTLRRYFREQWCTLPQPRAVDDVSSKTFMLTGSNVGLGFEACMHLAKLRPKLLFATSRDLAKCEQTQKSLERVAAGGVPSTEVFAWPLDLGSFQNVCAFVDKFAADGRGTLNTLVANAGVLSGSYAQTQDGWEVTLQVNYLSTALLSILLLPYLINSSTPASPSRLVVVSSFAHYHASGLSEFESWSNILEAINQREFGGGFVILLLCIPHHDKEQSSQLVSLVIMFQNSFSVLGVIFIRELASRLSEDTSIIMCTVNPGYCVSKISRNLGKKWAMSTFGRLFLVRSTEEGSRAIIHAAVASDRSMHGRYLSCCQVTEECDFLFTPEGKAFSARVWDETITLLSGIDSRISEIVERFLRVGS